MVKVGVKRALLNFCAVMYLQIYLLINLIQSPSTPLDLVCSD